MLSRAASEHVRDSCDDGLRLLVRTGMARWQLVPVACIHLGLLRHDDVDADVERLRGLPPERWAWRTGRRASGSEMTPPFHPLRPAAMLRSRQLAPTDRQLRPTRVGESLS